MAHKKKGSSGLSLHQQAYNILSKMFETGLGRSKRDDKLKGLMSDYIYSKSTYQGYWRHIKYFLAWMKQTHPEVTTLRKAKDYVNEWLEERERSGKYSAYTLQFENCALEKLFHISADDPERYVPPVRHRENITRSRLVTKSDAHFSEKRNALLVKFCKGTGLRRQGLTSITPERLYKASELPAIISKLQRKNPRTDEENGLLMSYKKVSFFKGIPNYYILTKEKGGKWRLAPIVGPYEDEIVTRIRETPPGKKVWGSVNKNCDVHAYRGEYAVTVYKMYARPIEEIPYDKVHKGTGHRYQSEVYNGRKDKKGLKLDAAAILRAELALGHNTLHTFVSHYSATL